MCVFFVVYLLFEVVLFDFNFVVIFFFANLFEILKIFFWFV